jgi:hypothetical protein
LYISLENPFIPEKYNADWKSMRWLGEEEVGFTVRSNSSPSAIYSLTAVKRFVGRDHPESYATGGTGSYTCRWIGGRKKCDQMVLPVKDRPWGTSPRKTVPYHKDGWSS